MPEEEGFTFVDKRRAQAEIAPEEIAPPEVPAPMEVPAPTAPTDLLDGDDDGAEDAEGTPDVYSLLGYCLSLLQADAWQKMGLLADPQTGEAAVDLRQAKVAIDAVGDLAAHLEGAPLESVPDSLRRDLRTLLNDLRLNYVAQQNKSA